MFPNGYRKVGKSEGGTQKPGFHAAPVPNASPKFATSTIGQQHPSPKGFRKVGGRAPMPMAPKRTGAMDVENRADAMAPNEEMD